MTHSLDVMEQLARRLPAWHLDAACRDADTSLFFAERGQPTSEAKRICRDCPVRVECLEYAIAEDLTAGIFGGMAPDQRRVYAGRRNRAIA